MPLTISISNVKYQPSKALIAANSTPGQIPVDITSVTDHISTEAIKSIENDPPEDLLTAVDVTAIQSDINTAVDSYTVESEKDLAVYVGTKISQKAVSANSNLTPHANPILIHS